MWRLELWSTHILTENWVMLKGLLDGMKDMAFFEIYHEQTQSNWEQLSDLEYFLHCKKLPSFRLFWLTALVLEMLHSETLCLDIFSPDIKIILIISIKMKVLLSTCSHPPKKITKMVKIVKTTPHWWKWTHFEWLLYKKNDKCCDLWRQPLEVKKTAKVWILQTPDWLCFGMQSFRWLLL